MAQRLERQGVIDSALRFQAYARLARTNASPVVGEHLLPGHLSPADAFACLTRSFSRPTVKLVIPEGYDRFQVAARLESLAIAAAPSFSRAATNGRLLSELGVPARSAEGYLFPATYEAFVDTPARAVLQRLVSEAHERHALIAADHADALSRLDERHGWSMHQIVTLASIVEREAATTEEHGVIASVFHNRLVDDTFRPLRRLQSDPTAGYGCRTLGDSVPSCKGFSGKVSAAMLRASDNPYNTYRHAGLPPGPISNPGESAIQAALEPASTPYLFFVSRDGKRHVFSRTHQEHKRAIRGTFDSSGQALR